jgi:hypothetical protein
MLLTKSYAQFQFQFHTHIKDPEPEDGNGKGRPQSKMALVWRENSMPPLRTPLGIDEAAFNLLFSMW